MKKFSLAVTIFIISTLFTLSAIAQINVEDKNYYENFKGKNITLNVYNWGEYISDGSDGSYDIIAEFEKISGISVNYTNFDTNENMYAKVANSGAQYDIIIPSDYMIARMISENMLEEINFDNIPNIKYIDNKYLYTDFDPEGKYSVPYTWCMVGLIYNTKYVTEEEASSWDILWNEKFSKKVLMFGNSRDAFAIALKKLGYSLNSENPDEIKQAADLLLAQKAVNQAYAMDQTYDKMANENAYAAPYYAGDCVNMMDKNEDLAFIYPKEGVNQFIDSICIPKGTKQKQAAEAFINFLCETEVAAANCEAIAYFSPHTEAADILGTDSRIYPSDEILEKSETFIMLSDDANKLYEDYWLQIKSTSDIPVGAIIIIASTIILITLTIIYIKKTKKKTDY